MHVPNWQTEPVGHGSPHAPQFWLSVERSRHTPAHTVSPVEHPRNPQRPNEQLRPDGHASPHMPQFWLSLRSEQRSPQRVSPIPHVVAQAPREHTWPAGHATPQAPQWARSYWTLTHVPAHAVWPSGQRHVPPEQISIARHALPQRPQFERLFVRGVSQPLEALPSQFAKPSIHGPPTQRPASHRCALTPRAMHGRPHAPQLHASVSTSASQPLAAFMSQSPKPGRVAHPGTPHVPATQTPATPDAAGHALPQRPQWLAFSLSSASQPLVGFVSQSPKPGSQRAITHWPEVQAAVARARTHARPHMPQWVTLLRVSVSQPFEHTPSQSANEGLQVRGEHTSTPIVTSAAGRSTGAVSIPDTSRVGVSSGEGVSRGVKRSGAGVSSEGVSRGSGASGRSSPGASGDDTSETSVGGASSPASGVAVGPTDDVHAQTRTNPPSQRRGSIG